MRTPPRAKKCQELLDDIEWNLEYFMGPSQKFKEMKNTHFQYLREYINEISQEKKLTEIKLAAKIKAGDKDDS